MVEIDEPPGFSPSTQPVDRKLHACRGLQPGSTARLLCDIFNRLNKGERIHLPQVTAAQELQIPKVTLKQFACARTEQASIRPRQ
jgi:hypothetical protein